jgi:hypothetical protein
MLKNVAVSYLVTTLTSQLHPSRNLEQIKLKRCLLPFHPVFCLPVSCLKTYNLNMQNYNFSSSFLWFPNTGLHNDRRKMAEGVREYVAADGIWV